MQVQDFGLESSEVGLNRIESNGVCSTQEKVEVMKFFEYTAIEGTTS